jgi:hypothetical protein
MMAAARSSSGGSFSNKRPWGDGGNNMVRPILNFFSMDIST